jgi:hypothetical protein
VLVLGALAFCAGNGNVLDQIAMINAAQFTPVDKTLIPTGEPHGT